MQMCSVLQLYIINFVLFNIRIIGSKFQKLNSEHRKNKLDKEDLFSKVINNEKIVNFSLYWYGIKVTIFSTSFSQINNGRLLSLGLSVYLSRRSVYHCGLDLHLLAH